MLSLDSSPSWFLFSLLAQFYYFSFLLLSCHVPSCPVMLSFLLKGNKVTFSEHHLNASGNTLKEMQGASNASLCLFSSGKLS